MPWEVLTLFHYTTHLCKLYLHTAEDLSYICEELTDFKGKSILIIIIDTQSPCSSG